MLKVIFQIACLMKSKKTSIFAISAIVAMPDIVSIAGMPESSAAKTKLYEVTVTNLTPGQPITPPLLVTHSENAGFFMVGGMVSNGIQQMS